MVAKSNRPRPDNAKSVRAGITGRLWLWLGAAVLAVCAVVLGLFVSMGQGASATRLSSSDVATISRFVPQNAVLTTLLRQLPDRLSARTGAIPPWQSILQQQTGLDYDRDVSPWLGEEGVFAILPSASPDESPTYLFALSVADGDRVREFLELLWQRQTLAGNPPVLATIDGAEAFLPVTGSGLWSMALVGDRYLLLASTTAALDRSLRAAQSPSLSLPYRPRYRAALLGMATPQLGLVHLNLPAAIAAVDLAQPPPSPQLSDGLISLDLNPQSLNLDVAVVGDALLPIPHDSPQVTPVSMASLPDTVVAMAVGHDLTSFWTGLTTELWAYRGLPYPLEQLQKWQATAAGEAAISMLATAMKGSYAVARTDVGDGILLTEHTPSVETAVAALDRLAQQQGLTVTPLTVRQQPVTAWTRLRTRTQTVRNGPGSSPQRETVVETQIVALHTIHQGYDLWATALPALVDTLNANAPKLVDGLRYRRAVERQEEYVYLDGRALLRQLSGQLPLLDLLDIAVQPLLNRLDTVVIKPLQGGEIGQLAKVIVKFTPA